LSQKCRMINIPISTSESETEVEQLNEFLSQYVYEEIHCNVVNAQPPFWSVLMFYDEDTEQKELFNPNNILPLKDVIKVSIASAIAMTDFSLSEAAKRLGLSRQELQQKMDEIGFDLKDFKKKLMARQKPF